ncbi:hypothetical protein ACIBQX_39335 [Nonomuraea sp. NPDC049714]|uniref:hypothetical protein n=1 Tax=Nonomuraea sp. NPDC049714 TaxID=3364357 RepID=UPI0037B60237
MRWLGYAIGGAFVALGLTGLVQDIDPVGWALWAGGVLVAHDAVLVPVVLLAGVVVRRAGGSVRAGLVVAGLVTLATLPTVLALGRRADNPSILPLDYGRNLLIVLVLIALASGIYETWTRAARGRAARGKGKRGDRPG